ncbi:MAG: DUF6476 family protein [Hyphomicrobium sp.]|jgi:uncharacterized membrane protein
MQETEAAEVPSAAEMRLQRNLKIVVLVLAVLLAAGLATIVARILYVASRSETQPAAVTASPTLRPGLSMQLPAGAEVKSISLSGDRLAVHYSAAGEEGIAVLDLRTGEPVASVGLKR